MGHKAQQRILNRRIPNGQEQLKETFKILSQQGNANQNNSEIPFFIGRMVKTENSSNNTC